MRENRHGPALATDHLFPGNFIKFFRVNPGNYHFPSLTQHEHPAPSDQERTNLKSAVRNPPLHFTGGKLEADEILGAGLSKEGGGRTGKGLGGGCFLSQFPQ